MAMCAEATSTLVNLAQMCSRICPWSSCRIVGGQKSFALEIAPKLRDFSQFPTNAIYPVIFVRDNVAHVLADASHVHKQTLSAENESEMETELRELMELYFDVDALYEKITRRARGKKQQKRTTSAENDPGLAPIVKEEQNFDEGDDINDEDMKGNDDVNEAMNEECINEDDWSEENEECNNNEESEKDFLDYDDYPNDDGVLAENERSQPYGQEDVNLAKDNDETEESDARLQGNVDSDEQTSRSMPTATVCLDAIARTLATATTTTSSTSTTTSTISSGKPYTSYNGGSKSPNWRRVKNPDGREMAECLICLKLLRPSSIGSHVRLQHRDEGKRTQYHCDLCPNVYTTRAGLRDHYRKHTGEEPYCCIYCGKTFKQASRLNSCMRRHEKNFLHTCKICGRGFYERDRLKVHMRTHTGEKPYGCVYCSFRCTRKSNLFIHVRGVHKALVEPTQPLQYKHFTEDDEFEIKIGGYVLKDAKGSSTTAMDSDSELV